MKNNLQFVGGEEEFRINLDILLQNLRSLSSSKTMYFKCFNPCLISRQDYVKKVLVSKKINLPDIVTALSRLGGFSLILFCQCY